MFFLGFILLAAIWGSSFLFLRIAINDFGPVLLANLRVVFAFLSLLPFLLLLNKKKIQDKKFVFFIFLGILNSALPFVLFGYSATVLPAGYLAVINSFVPVWSLFLSVLFLGESIRMKTFFSLLLGVLGVMVVVGFGPVSINSKEIIAILFAFFATFCYAISGVLTKKYCQNISGLLLSLYCLGSASIVLFPFSFVDLHFAKISSVGIISVLMLGILCSGVALLLYFNLLKTVGPVKTTTVTFVVPAFGTMWGTIFLNELFTISMAIGILLILAASISVFFEKSCV